LEIHRGLGVQVQDFPKDRNPTHKRRTTAQVGGMDFSFAWVLTIDKDQRVELLQKFFRQLLRTATESLDSIDMLKLGIPEKQEVARLLETFNQAVITSREMDRYLTDARIAAEALSGKEDAAQETELAENGNLRTTRSE
jgi:hypothetical protein